MGAQIFRPVRADSIETRFTPAYPNSLVGPIVCVPCDVFAPVRLCLPLVVSCRSHTVRLLCFLCDVLCCAVRDARVSLKRGGGGGRGKDASLRSPFARETVDRLICLEWLRV